MRANNLEFSSLRSQNKTTNVLCLFYEKPIRFLSKFKHFSIILLIQSIGDDFFIFIDESTGYGISSDERIFE